VIRRIHSIDDDSFTGILKLSGAAGRRGQNEKGGENGTELKIKSTSMKNS
jgi:hypothetical protein